MPPEPEAVVLHASVAVDLLAGDRPGARCTHRLVHTELVDALYIELAAQLQVRTTTYQAAGRPHWACSAH
jgi:hypothetical protein